jgi:hypothetical protein
MGLLNAPTSRQIVGSSDSQSSHHNRSRSFLADAAPPVAAAAGFLAGSFTGNLLMNSIRRYAERSIFLISALLMTVFMVWNYAHHPPKPCFALRCSLRQWVY